MKSNSRIVHKLRTLSPQVALITVTVLLAACGKAPTSDAAIDTATKPAESLAAPTREKAAVTHDLRGYGKVSARGSLWQGAKGDVSLVTFEAEDADKATILANKYATDLAAYGAVSQVKDFALGGGAFAVRYGGLWIVGQKGREVFVLSGPDAEALGPYAKTLGASEWKAPVLSAYPRYLDNFDNAALGMWWMPSTKPKEILDFFREQPGIVNAHGARLKSVFAPHVYENTAVENIVAQAKEIGKPYRLMFWGDFPIWWESSVGNNISGELMPSGARVRSLFEESGYHAHQFATPAADAVHLDSMIHYMNTFKDDPELMAWMEPHGEFFESDPLGLPPGGDRLFRKYLQNVKGYTLEKANELYGTQARTWEDIPYPDIAFFHGRRGTFKDLDDDLWRWNTETLEAGVASGFEQPGFDDSDWPEELRTSTRVLSQYSNKTGAPVWFRFNVDIPAAMVAGDGPVFLNIMPYTLGGNASASAWINGISADKKSGEEASLGAELRLRQFDVTGLVKAGMNQFTIFNSGRIKYRVFLSRLPYSPFPFPDRALTRLWLDWTDHYKHEKFMILKHYLEVMRAVDPIRPIKVMTPHLFQSEAMDLMKKYGAYPQLTGEGSFYRPMHYKGYSRLHGLPGSSEGGSPMPNAAGMQTMFAYIFWSSQDKHDYVFDAQRDFWSKPDVVKWWSDNAPLLRTLGKTDFGPSRVGVLRDVQQQSRFKNSDIWRWDLSRGPLPSAGVSPVLIDGGEFDQGLAARVPVIFDCSTSVMTAERVAAVKRYVEQGGTFIAAFNTGRHDELTRDSWPLAKAFGLKVQDVTADPNLDNWPVEKIQFTQEQEIFPSLKGKKVQGRGISIDHLGKEETGAIRMETDRPNVKPVATWEDGSMAVCDISLGKGRLIWIGTPFHVDFKDENGIWMNQTERQALLEQLLDGLGVAVEAKSTDPRVWIEKRESKNGLYDVFMATAMNIPGREWKLEDQISTDLLLKTTAAEVVEPTLEGSPSQTFEPTAGGMLLRSQTFTPFQVRQFAVVRKDAGLEGPFVWFEAQHRHWNALDVPKADLEAIQKAAAAEIEKSGQDGVNLTKGWKVRVSTDASGTPEDAWREAAYDATSWKEGQLGTWLLGGWPDARRVQYVRDLVLPDGWDAPGKRVLLGFDSITAYRMQGKSQIWLNGQELARPLALGMLMEVGDKFKDGKLRVAIDATGDSMGAGPSGTMYLRLVDKPLKTYDLAGPWDVFSDWRRKDGAVTLPGTVDKGFGLRHSFELPSGWEGKQVRLVIEQIGNLQGLMVNADGYLRADPGIMEPWSPVGIRIDNWLKPGENTIDLYPAHHHNYNSRDKQGTLKTEIKSIRLELYK